MTKHPQAEQEVSGSFLIIEEATSYRLCLRTRYSQRCDIRLRAARRQPPIVRRRSGAIASQRRGFEAAFATLVRFSRTISCRNSIYRRPPQAEVTGRYQAKRSLSGLLFPPDWVAGMLSARHYNARSLPSTPRSQYFSSVSLVSRSPLSSSVIKINEGLAFRRSFDWQRGDHRGGCQPTAAPVRIAAVLFIQHGDLVN